MSSTPTINRQSDSRLTELDALRGLAAMAVVIFHFLSGYPNLFPEQAHVGVRADWGRFGVDLFFAISGFVIFMTLNHTTDAKDFIVSRFSRLFPTYWFCIIITFCAMHMIGPDELKVTPEDALVNFTMFQLLLFTDHVDASYWSLLPELVFYFCMICLWREGGLKQVERTLLFWFALTWAIRLLPMSFPVLKVLLLVEFLPFFALGILTFRVWRGERSLAGQLPVWAVSLLTLIVFLPKVETISYIVVSAIMMLLGTGKLSWLRHPVLVWLGVISYPLYLIHQYIGYTVMLHLDAFGISPALSLVSAFIVALGLAAAISRWIEKPALAVIREGWKNRRKALTSA
jgi:peptidoglycan/LPS O-acetylase OafA/YrhL